MSNRIERQQRSYISVALRRFALFVMLINLHRTSAFTHNNNMAFSRLSHPEPTLVYSTYNQAGQINNYDRNRCILQSTVAGPTPPSEMSNFERKMRTLVDRQQRKKTARATAKSRRPQNLQVVTTLEEYDKTLKAAKGKIVVVRFYAKWCKACKAIAPSYYRLANIYESAVFIDVPVTEKNANLHQGLGVPSLPFGHIYHPSGGLVEELKMSKRHFPKFARSVTAYMNGICDLEDEQVFNSKTSE